MAEDKKRDDFVVELGDRNGKSFEPAQPILSSQSSNNNHSTPKAAAAMANNPIFPVLSYCGSSILMTVTNKYVLSGLNYNLNFFLLCVQVRRSPFPFEAESEAGWRFKLC